MKETGTKATAVMEKVMKRGREKSIDGDDYEAKASEEVSEKAAKEKWVDGDGGA